MKVMRYTIRSSMIALSPPFKKETKCSIFSITRVQGKYSVSPKEFTPRGKQIHFVSNTHFKTGNITFNRELNYLRMNYKFEKNHTFTLYDLRWYLTYN